MMIKVNGRCGLFLVGGLAAWVANPSQLMAQVSDGAVGESTAPQGLLQIVFSGGLFGGAIIFVLLGLSVTAAYLVFDHFLTIRRSEVIPDNLEQQVGQALAKGDVQRAVTICKERPSFTSFVLLQGLAEADAGWPAIEKGLEDALADQAARLLRKIEYLSVIGNIAPMVGLLGTVTGMIFAFQQVAASQGAAGAGELAAGIYQALVTTVGGLIVAIPSLASFAILRNRVDQLVAEVAYMVQHVCRPLRRRAPGSASTPPPVRPATS